MRMTRTARLALIALVTSIAAVGCAEYAAAGTGDAGASAKRGALVKIVPSRYGRVVADRTGEAIYLFTADGRGKSQCYGQCAEVWPPFLTKGKPRAGKGVKQSALGTTRRRDGKLQVTYKGQPLYYFKGDGPGVILCQNVNEYGGYWLVVAPSGRAITLPR